MLREIYTSSFETRLPSGLSSHYLPQLQKQTCYQRSLERKFEYLGMIDHLLILEQIFGDRSLTVEDLMRERGQLVKKGTLSEDGSLEFWEDGTATEREGKTGTASEKVAGELE